VIMLSLPISQDCTSLHLQIKPIYKKYVQEVALLQVVIVVA